jgi:hypothetical protein
VVSIHLAGRFISSQWILRLNGTLCQVYTSVKHAAFSMMKPWQFPNPSCIKPLEANDSIFEFAFPGYPGEDGSGVKGFENLEQNFYLPRRTGTPRLSRRNKSVSDTPMCPGKRNFLNELRAVFSFS